MSARKAKLPAWQAAGLICAMLIGIGAFVLHRLGFGLAYQETDSMPKGWYWQLPAGTLKRHDIVIFTPPVSIQQYLIAHRWLGEQMTLMKHVMGLPGDKVCVKAQKIYINQQWVADIYQDYAPHHPLPQWQFCGRVPANQYLLMSTYAKRSFDGRYFGFISRDAIISKAVKV